MRVPKKIRKPRRLGAAPLIVALACALGGCSNAPATDGPLSGGAYGGITGGSECAPARVGQPITFGIELFTNNGNARVVLDRVVLLHPRHERLVGSYAVPGRLMIGVVAWPPRYKGLPPTWKHRQPVHGFRLAPGNSFNLVLGIAATSAGAVSSRGLVIRYHDSAGSYLTISHIEMLIAANKLSC